MNKTAVIPEAQKTQGIPQDTLQTFPIDIRKLSYGLKTTFEGVAMVFDSIGSVGDITSLLSGIDLPKMENTTKAAMQEAVKVPVEPSEVAQVRAAPDAQKVQEAPESQNAPEVPKWGAAEVPEAPTEIREVIQEANTEIPDKALTKAPAEDSAESATEASADESAPEPDPIPVAPTVSTLTQDDLTRIVVKKIRSDRNNNVKIGQILKTYGVSKISELAAEKYEAFVTDLAAL